MADDTLTAKQEVKQEVCVKEEAKSEAGSSDEIKGESQATATTNGEAAREDQIKKTEVKVKVKAEAKDTDTQTVKAEVDVKSDTNGGAASEKAVTPKDETPAVVKTDPDLIRKIINQVEYYFGDANLMKDKFLQTKIKEDNGWVALSILLTFNRLKSLSEDVSVIISALDESTTGLLQISMDRQKVRRSVDHPLPNQTEEWKVELAARSAYAKGFPLDVTLDKLLSFLGSFGKVDHIQMRRDREKKFKRSVFVIFVSKEGCSKFMDQEELKFETDDAEPLLRQMKDDYFNVKKEARKQMKGNKQKEKEEERIKQAKATEDEFQAKITHGTIMVLSGFEGKMDRQDVKNFFNDKDDCGTVVWVDLHEEKKEVRLRFKEENQAKDILEKLKDPDTGKVKVLSQTLEGLVLEGDEESSHWKGIFESQSRKRKAPGGGGGRGRGRGGKRHRGGRR